MARDKKRRFRKEYENENSMNHASISKDSDMHDTDGAGNHSGTENDASKGNAGRQNKEFVKDDKSIREDATKLQQKGGGEQINDMEMSDEIEQFERTRDDGFKDQKHIQKDIQNEIDEPKKKQPVFERQDDYARGLKTKRLADMRAGIEHDMREQALGQIYKVAGSNIDYDEINKMSRNNIRDASELAGESLQNDGFDEKVDEIEKMMENNVRSGKPDINEIVEISHKEEPGVMAQAFVNVVKEASVKDTDGLSKIFDACNFEHPGYERIFDNIRNFDKAADMVMDKFEMAVGRERLFDD